MPFAFNADLLGYYEQNVPTNSQTTPIPTITYPPIPISLAGFSTTALSDMSINATISPFSTLPLSGMSTVDSPATIGTFAPPQFVVGSAYNTAYTDPNSPPTPAIPAGQTGYFNPAGTNNTITTANSPATPTTPAGQTGYFTPSGQNANVTTPNSPATTTAMNQSQFAAGTPGNMTYNNAYTDPNLPATPNIPAGQTGYFSPSGQNANITTGNSPQMPTNTNFETVDGADGSLLSLGQGVAVPPNNMSPISALPEGSADEWKPGLSLLGQWKTLGVGNVFTDTFATGFDKDFKVGQPSKFIGIEGQIGALTYAKPPSATDLAETPNLYNSVSKYSLDTRFAGIADLESEVKYTSHFNNLEGTDKIKTLKSIYEQSNYATQAIRFDGRNVKPHVLRGIQMESPNYDRVDGIPDSAAEHKIRLEAAIEGSTWEGGWKERRKRLRNFQFQSRFQLGLGILPHLFLMGGPYNNKQDLKIKDEPGLLAMASAKAWILGGTIARVPHHLTNYSMLNSLGIKYGFSPFGEKLYNMLGKLSSKLDMKNVDIVPFYFDYYHRSSPNNSPLFSTEKDTKKGYLQFRGTLKTISHSITPQWSSKKYFGRPDSVHTYSGFGQNLSFSFQVYAATRNDMVEMYKNLNDLISLTKPGWDANYSYMKAPVTELTIGDYMKKQPGFLASLSISPDEQVYWDLGKDPIKGLPQIAQAVPQGLIDSVPFLGSNPKKLRTNRESLLEFPLAKAPNPQGKVVPRAYNVSVTYTMIEKELPNADGAPVWDYEKTIF